MENAIILCSGGLDSIVLTHYLKKIKNILHDLVNESPLDARHRDHKLIGYYKGRRECHVEADWLLIYKTTEQEIIFERTGTHSDLFD